VASEASMLWALGTAFSAAAASHPNSDDDPFA